MRRPIPKYLALCIIASFLCIEYALGQCQFEIQYTIEEKSKSAYNIHLNSETSLDLVKVQLYDLYQGKVLIEKNLPSLTAESQEVFTNIPPSRYAIIIRVDDCDKPKTLGGIKGIGIGIQD